MAEATQPAHDVHEEELRRFKTFLVTNGKTIGIAVIAALVSVTGFRLYRSHTQSRNIEAVRLLGQSRTAQELEDLVAQYGSTPAAPLALLRLAKTYFDMGDPFTALRKYEEFLSSQADHPLAEGAELGKAWCLEAAGRSQEALAAFQSFREKRPESFLIPQAVLGQGHCLQQLGKDDEARIVFEDWIAAHPENPWKSVIQEALDGIGKKLESAESRWDQRRRARVHDAGVHSPAGIVTTTPSAPLRTPVFSPPPAWTFRMRNRDCGILHPCHA